MKQRFSSLDVKVIAHELSNSLVTLRLSNIYDLSSRIFLLKFAKPDHREQLIVDSGFRCHLTSFARTTAAAPSAFVSRLRKYLRTRRVTSVAQVGTDRIIEIQFSDGQYRLFLEFYAGGNIILTDSELNITGLLRNVNEGAEHEQLRLGLKYNLSLRQNYGGIPPLTKERLSNGLQKAIERQQDSEKAATKKIKKKPGDALRKALAISITEYPPMLVDHAFKTTGFDASVKPEDIVGNSELLEQLLGVLQEAGRTLDAIVSADVAKGYIIAKRTTKSSSDDQALSTGTDKDSKRGDLLYEDFHPFKPKQFEENPDLIFLEFEGFNKTVDEFFSSIEAQKLESRLQDREETAKKKLEAARQDHAKRIEGLNQVQELNVRKAQAIEANLDRVEETCAAVNGLIAQGMDWMEVAKLIEMEQSRHNPVAEIIKLPLKLYENTITLLLAEETFDDEEDDAEETDEEPSESENEDGESTKGGQQSAKTVDKRLTVDIDLGYSAWSNARQYYDQKRNAAVKQEKTEQASVKALKSTEQKIAADLKKGLRQEKAVLRPVRRQMWFEKFIYFISSDGYLVLGGKDAQQNEILYKKYLKKGDIYVHADLHGAASVIIKNNPATPDAPIPPSTLSQAGNLSVCTSGAWDSKAVMSAWWVNSDQVSKTAPTGEYLTAGSFMIRGKKNFLPPAQLLLGFAVMFQISDESKARHVKHRLQDEKVDEELPKAKGDREEGRIDTQDASAESSESDSDEDFPDAKLDSPGADSEEEIDPVDRHNPLQSTSLQGSNSREQPHEANNEAEQSDNDKENDESAEVSAASAAEEESSVQGTQDGTSDKKIRHISARERRLLRKGQDPTSAQQSGTEGEADSEAEQNPVNPKPQTKQAPSQTGPSNKKAPLPRGKRGKQKKLATKYADQDEEDRELALALLGSRAAQEKAKEDATAQADKAKELAAAKERRREQHKKTQQEGLEKEEIRRLNFEENIDQLDEEEEAKLTALDALIGTPLPGDEILEAIPVCAPWAALSKYKYKAKLQPGAVKKGKAVKEILGRWAADGQDRKKVDDKSEDVERIWPREVELIRGWKEQEVFGVVPVGKVRVLMSGGVEGGKGGKSGGGQKGGGRGGRGSKKQR